MCVRIRMTFGNGGVDYTSRAWDLDRVGIWYGSWRPEDLYAAYGNERPIISVEVARRLNERMETLGTQCTISPSGVAVARRFDDLSVGTWVFAFSGRTLHFAQIANEDLYCEPDVFRIGDEVFKYKAIHNKKSFALAELPEPFMLLAPAGRSNVHHVNACEGLVELLRDSSNAAEVRRKFDAMPWDEWLAALGPKGWESLCTGFLILMKGYLPSGLAVGGTLADFDIVGSLGSGKAVFAQCKNDRTRRTIRENDALVFGGLEAAECYYFAYSGVDQEIPGVTHIDGAYMINWLDTDPKGQEYKRRLRNATSNES